MGAGKPAAARYVLRYVPERRDSSAPSGSRPATASMRVEGGTRIWDSMSAYAYLCQDGQRIDRGGEAQALTDAGETLAAHGVTGEWHQNGEHEWVLDGPLADPETWSFSECLPEGYGGPRKGNAGEAFAATMRDWGHQVAEDTDEHGNRCWTVSGRRYQVVSGEDDISGGLSGDVSFRYHPVGYHDEPGNASPAHPARATGRGGQGRSPVKGQPGSGAPDRGRRLSR